jgi:hypothetical protein
VTLHAVAAAILAYRRALRLLAEAVGWASTGVPFALMPPGPLWRPKRPRHTIDGTDSTPPAV